MGLHILSDEKSRIMINLIPHVIAIAAIIVGTHLTIRGLLHAFVNDPDAIYEGLSRAGQHLAKPLWACPTCMASIHGTFWHFYFDGGLTYWVPTCLALAFVNTLFNKWVS